MEWKSNQTLTKRKEMATVLLKMAPHEIQGVNQNLVERATTERPKIMPGLD
jgi:hypothetical protein